MESLLKILVTYETRTPFEAFKAISNSICSVQFLTFSNMKAISMYWDSQKCVKMNNFKKRIME